MEALIVHYLKAEPCDDWDAFLMQASKARWLHKHVFNTTKAAVNHGLAGKEGG